MNKTTLALIFAIFTGTVCQAFELQNNTKDDVYFQWVKLGTMPQSKEEKTMATPGGIKFVPTKGDETWYRARVVTPNKTLKLESLEDGEGYYTVSVERIGPGYDRLKSSKTALLKNGSSLVAAPTLGREHLPTIMVVN